MFLYELESYGYNVYYGVLNSKGYGIPQNRERIYVVIIKKSIDNGKFSFPAQEYNYGRLNDFLLPADMSKFYESDISGIYIDGSIKPSVRKIYERDLEKIISSEKEMYQCRTESGFQDCKVGITVAPTLRAGNPQVIYRHKEKYSVSEMCRFFKVSRSGYYGYVTCMNIPAKDLNLANKIQECQEKCGKTYGYRRVHIWLERQGVHHNPKTILRVMQKYNLLSVVRRKKYRNYGKYLHRYPNLLNRDFKAERPNQKWVTDISYIKTNQGTLYLSIIRDLFDNSIVAYKTGTEQNINLVLQTIREAQKKEKVTAEVQLHSDQGFQYTSQAYYMPLKKSIALAPETIRFFPHRKCFLFYQHR